MRIDYSEPKKSYSSTTQSPHNRNRRESSVNSGSSGNSGTSGSSLMAPVLTGLLCLAVGFGGGWTLSQRSAKKAFKAAMEQQSLETSPAAVAPPPKPQLAAVPQQAPTPQKPETAATDPTAAATPGAKATADQPLSFYKTLPSGQKSNVMGSGVNVKDEKPAKQPLQAALPANMARPVPQPGDENQAAPTPAAPAAKGGRDASGLTVQVASFSLRSEAETLRTKLASKGYNVNIVESRLGDKGTWYRVRVGKHLEPDGAKELSGKLGKSAIVIPDKE